MWSIRYNNEVRNYFLDNDELVFGLLVRIEELRHTKDGIPPEGATQLELNFYWWEVLRHIVLYERQGNTLIIEMVKPIE